MNDPELPPRYEAKWRLGQGGGGEVWAVRDRVTLRTLALKVLAKDASAVEAMALVREAVALSGLEGLGVPRVVGFGALADGRRYLVRELVEGTSLDDVLGRSAAAGTSSDARGWLVPLAHAADQLTTLHRAGLLHGDLKPANVIVGPDGRGTLVDLGLAAPWREGGTVPKGLTPKYAAPELLAGAPLTVRAEVYALGATLAEGLARRGAELPDAARLALEKVAARATEAAPQARYPSVDELANALRTAAGLDAPAACEPAWPVVGLDAVSTKLQDAACGLAPGEGLAIDGPPGSGRSTLVRRLAWSLGVDERPVAVFDAPSSGLSRHEAVEVELSSLARGELTRATLVVDDAVGLDAASRAALRSASGAGARIVAAGSTDAVHALCAGTVRAFEVPRLGSGVATELVRRAMPSLSEAIAAHLVLRTDGRPGRLRAAVRGLAGRAVVSPADVEDVLAADPESEPATDIEAVARAERLLAMGQLASAGQLLARVSPGADLDVRVRAGVANAKLLTEKGDAKGALDVLGPLRDDALRSAFARAYSVALARAALRGGDYALAVRAATDAIGGVKGATGAHGAHDADPLTAEALSVLGLAQAFTGDDVAASKTLDAAVASATHAGQQRALGVALGSLGIVQQRAGHAAQAKATYERALVAAEGARDASTVSATRMNLAGLARGEGDLAAAILHLEAAIDMGRRAGGLSNVRQAGLNLANLDLYLGRYARARASIGELVLEWQELSPTGRAQLLGLQAELAARTGEPAAAARLYEQSACAWDAQDRPLDAAEARIESILVRATDARAGAALDEELQRIEAAPDLLRAHPALARLARGWLDALAGREKEAQKAYEAGLDVARKNHDREHAWWILEARSRLSAGQGNVLLARRDAEAAQAILEEIAAKLPRDLREVFWDDARRRALRHAATASEHGAGIASGATPHGPSVTLGSAEPAAQTRMPADADRLRSVLEITRDLAREHDLTRLLGKVTDQAIALLGGERGFVVLANAAGELETHAARDRQGDDPHARFSRSVAETVVRTGEPVVTTSARDDARLAHAVSVHQLMIQSIACVPVGGAPPAGRPIGALYVETRLRPGVRFQRELPTLMAFADQVAIAIENARLIEENRLHMEALEHANEELGLAKEKLAELLGRRTEQLALTRRSLKEVRAELRGHFGYAGLVGTSAAMRKVYALIDRVKDTDVPILLTGESGTGKEMVARAIHQSGPRAKRAFLGVNCGAIPANLLESELFGHTRGAFTGAERDRRGLFREAEGGTILLDEIGELPKPMQPVLLRTLQEKTVRPVGSAKEEPVDVRVIAATNRDLEQMVADGSFREDLFYRLHVVDMRVPPLRERTEDLPALIDHFLGLFAARHKRERKTVDKRALQRLSSYAWPGNVRQLEHVLLNAWLMSEAPELVVEDFQLPDRVALSTPSRAASGHQNEAEFRDEERARILAALAACNWNRVQAAKMSGIPRRTFYRRLKEFGIL